MDNAAYDILWAETLKMLKKAGKKISELEHGTMDATRREQLASNRKLYDKLIGELEQMHREFNTVGGAK
jgi:uncharacterized membrane protein